MKISIVGGGNTALSYPLTDLHHVAVRQHVKVGLQASVMNGLPIPVCFEGPTETNIVTNGSILLEISARLALLSS
jgi:uridylate kinase